MTAEQRAAFRVPVPEDQSQAVLRMGMKDFKVRVLNASATGFSLSCPVLDVECGELLKLCTSSGWVEIRVAFIGPSSEGYRLGVERVREIPPASGGRAEWVQLLLFPYHQAGGAAGLAVIGGVIVALIVVGLPLLGHVWPPARTFKEWSPASRFTAAVEKAFAPARQSRPVVELPQIQRSLPSTGNAAPTRSANAARNHKVKVATLVQAWRGGKARDLARLLRLSERQVREIDDLLIVHATGKDPDAIVLEKRLTEILTPEQVRAL
jgi:hypothetical protein